jgi:hypothetical protein
MVILYGGRIRAAGTGAELLTDTQHTLLRTPRLSADALAAVGRALESAQGVRIESVEAPRQSLESLFLEIVERARAEQLATSGAQSGGRIASFLQGEEGGEGASVVEELVRAGERPAPAAAAALSAKAPEAPRGADASVLDALVEPSKTQPPAPAVKPGPRESRDASGGGGPDRGVIDSLLGGDGGGSGDGSGSGDGGKKK